MRVILFCVLAFVVGCSDGAAPEATATGGSAGQAATGGSGGHVDEMTATGGVVGGAAGTGGMVDAGADASSPVDATPNPCVSIPRTASAGPDPCGGPGTGQFQVYCVNLQEDRSNCGACFHMCATAGFGGCQDGICQ